MKEQDTIELKEARQKAGMTQKQIADLFKIHQRELRSDQKSHSIEPENKDSC